MRLTRLENKLKYFVAPLAGVLLTTSCALIDITNKMRGRPKSRFGCAPISTTLGLNYPNPEKLGKHNSNEKNGQVYTLDGGFIDLAHLRKSADWAKILAQKSYKNILENKTEFDFKLVEPCRYNVKLTYPKDWDSLSDLEKQTLAKETSADMGSYFSYVSTTWHEMITWFGYKSTIILPESHSAFTFEDQFSNFLGSYLASKVLGMQGDFDTNFTKLLDDELKKLKVQPKKLELQLQIN